MSSAGLVPICFRCSLFSGVEPAIGFACEAFPEGIPTSILASVEDHRYPVEGDHGIRFAPMALGEDDAKLSKASVDYSYGKGHTRCRYCEHFETPHECEVVAGYIDPEFWCERFKADVSRETQAGDDWNEADHPRGQPENAGEFVKGGGASAGHKAIPDDYKRVPDWRRREIFRKEGKYLYHGTPPKNVESISENGIIPSLGGPGSGNPNLPPRRVARSYFTSYESQNYIGNGGSLFRINVADLPEDITKDLRGDYFTTVRIPPQFLEIKRGDKWAPVNKVAQPKADPQEPEQRPEPSQENDPVGSEAEHKEFIPALRRMGFTYSGEVHTGMTFYRQVGQGSYIVATIGIRKNKDTPIVWKIGDSRDGKRVDGEGKYNLYHALSDVVAEEDKKDAANKEKAAALMKAVAPFGYTPMDEPIHGKGYYFQFKDASDNLIYVQENGTSWEFTPGSGSPVDVGHDGEGMASLVDFLRREKRDEDAANRKYLTQAREIAAKTGYDPKMISVSSSQKTVTVGGVAGGVLGETDPRTGKITLFAPVIKSGGEGQLESTIVHECMHGKFQPVLNEGREEGYAIRQLPREEQDKIWEPGETGIKPEYKDKYPVRYALAPLFYDQKHLDALKAEDGVSDYSHDWWNEVASGNAPAMDAINETLAEVASDDVLGESAKVKPIWRELYNTINSLWATRDSWPHKVATIPMGVFGAGAADEMPPAKSFDQSVLSALCSLVAGKLRGTFAMDAAWNEADHPRGQPGNAGEFVSAGGQTGGKSEGGTPNERSTRASASGAPTSSSAEAPPGRQELAKQSQLSTLPVPSASSTKRASMPSIFTGPKTVRFTDLELGAIDPASRKKVLQASNNASALLAQAKNDQPQFRAYLDDLTRHISGLAVVGVRVKDEPGLREKIEAKHREPATISDYIGGRVSAETPSALGRAAHYIEATGAVLDRDNFMHGKFGGYRAIHYQVGLGDGMSAELQLVPKPIADVQEEAHKPRDRVKRLLDEENTGDHLTAAQLQQIAQADKESRAIFDKAWANAGPEWHGEETETAAHDAWDPQKHPRGQPNNAGQFASSPGGGSAKAKPAKPEPARVRPSRSGGEGSAPTIDPTAKLPFDFYDRLDDFGMRYYGDKSRVEQYFTHSSGDSLVVDIPDGGGEPEWRLMGIDMRHPDDMTGKGLGSLVDAMRKWGLKENENRVRTEEVQRVIRMGFHIASEDEDTGAVTLSDAEKSPAVIVLTRDDNTVYAHWKLTANEQLDGSGKTITKEGLDPDGLIKALVEVGRTDAQRQMRRQDAKTREVREILEKGIKEVGYDPSLFEFVDHDDTFMLNGQRLKRAGAAELGTGKILLYPRTMSSDPDYVLPALYHEVEHQKFQAVLNAYKHERQRMHDDDRGGDKWIMKPDGTLRPEYAADYPVYAALEPIIEKQFDKLRDTDGVTDYSKDWWKAHLNGTATIEQAYHETLAEIAFLEKQGGSVPKNKVSPVWRDFYKAVNDLYPNVSHTPDPNWYKLTPAPAPHDLPEGYHLIEGKGPLGRGKWAVRWPENQFVTNLFPTQQEAIEQAKVRVSEQAATKERETAKHAREQDIAQRLRAGKDPTDSDIRELGLKPTAGFAYLSPVVQRLFGISPREVRASMKGSLRRTISDMGAEGWQANARAALREAAAYAEAKNTGMAA